MDELVTRITSQLIGRLDGPLAFRFILQPTVAAIYAIHDALADAREGKPAYFWSILTGQTSRWSQLSEGWHHVARVILLGVIMDVIYQLMVFRMIYPFELVVIVLTLAFLPYLLLRGPLNRLARYWAEHRPRHV